MDRDMDMIYNAQRDIFYVNIILPRIYIRDVQNPFELYNDLEFKRRFRFRKETIIESLLPLCRAPATNRGLPVSPAIAVLLISRFYATENFQIVCGDLKGLNQSTISRTITKVTMTIARRKSATYIKFPENAVSINEIKGKFREISNFPNVVGSIDCTHIPIKNPRGPNAELFRNRKRNFSINVQVVCGPELQIFDVVARYPGSYHDSHIFNRSSVKEKFQTEQLQGYLLGI